MKNNNDVPSIMAALGFELWKTGGGCQGYGLVLPSSRALVVTDDGGTCVPQSVSDLVVVCCYKEEGSESECLEFKSLQDFLDVF
ncbi:MAG: hypothetical protein KKB70_10535 [Proteobacteria bacterium]|nr:hypothetical protein [Pseudomonadota bacterium]MBU1568447.1 hypothetical protein [Pseudomonadota bacterium]